MVDNNEKIAVCVTIEIFDKASLEVQLQSLGVLKYVFAPGIQFLLKYEIEMRQIKANPKVLDYMKGLPFHTNGIIPKLKYDIYHYIMQSQLYHYDQVLLICTVGKTGDNTFISTFEGQNIEFYNVWHMPELFEKSVFLNLNQKVKIITGVREPIGQNLSYMYQYLSAFKYWFITQYKEILFQGKGDAQMLFDQWSKDRFNIIESYSECTNFIKRFEENVIDIMKEPFDKEKGYTVIKEDNIEVFVYTLEKLNDNISALSEFVGGDFTEFVIGNEAESKWTAGSYKQAQKELKLSQEYFDSCYNEPYVKHFYSDEDIEKFKNKWKNNIEA